MYNPRIYLLRQALISVNIYIKNDVRRKGNQENKQRKNGKL